MKPTLIIVSFLFCAFLSAQRTVYPGQELLYPNVNDPSFVGNSRRVEVTGILQVSDVERQQTSQYIFAQLPIYDNVAFGVDYFKDRFDYFSYSSTMLSTVYTIGRKNHHLKLGLSGGIDSRKQDRIPLDQLPDDDNFVPDINANNRSFTYRGGLHYTLSGFTLGGFYNRIPIQKVTPRNDLDDLLEYRIEEGFTAYAQYGINFGDNFTVTPIVRYLSYDEDAIYEGALRVDLKNRVSATVSYKNEYSLNPALRFHFFKALQIGYSYETALGNMNFEDVHSLSISYNFKKNDEDDPEWMENAKKNNEEIDAIKPEKPKKEKRQKPKPDVTEEKPIEVAKPEPKAKEVLPEPKPEVVEKPQVKEQPVQVGRIKTGLTLNSGFYVVVGTFDSMQQAEQERLRLQKLDYYTAIGKKPGENKHYLYIDSDNNGASAQKRLRAHKLDKNFRNAYLLGVD